MEATEKNEIQNINTYIFLINRSSLEMNKIDVEFDLSFTFNSYNFIYTAYNHGHTQTFTNMDTKIRGIFFKNSIMSTNVYAENITFDAAYALGGFNYYSS